MKEWLDQDPGNARLLAEESFILDATESIWEAIESQSLTKAKLAEKAGCSRALISQLLSGSRNMTLRTYAQLCFALGLRPTISATAAHKPHVWEPAADWGLEVLDLCTTSAPTVMRNNVYPIRPSIGERATNDDTWSSYATDDEYPCLAVGSGIC